MSIALPFLAFFASGMFAAYHRLRLAVWAAMTAALLVGCWLLGANHVATIVAGVLVVLIALPLLVPQLRKPFITGAAAWAVYTQAVAAAVRYRAHRAGIRHGRFRGPAVLRRPGLGSC
jgi:hypothetical protein